MKKMLKLYFSDKRICLYVLLASILLVYLVINDIIFENYHIAFIIIILAPFYEWLAHKYILHLSIGAIYKVEVDDINNYNVGQKIKIKHRDQTIEGEIIGIDTNSIKVANGLAKRFPRLYNFMDELHYGHHRDPDDIPLIFAPLLVVIILYLKVFAITYFITRNMDTALSALMGVMIYFIYYEWVHLGHHVKGYNHLTWFGRKMKRVHQWHHYKNENYWWGITNPFGDVIFGTFKNHEKVEQSKTVKTINH